jgi:hypothetical protein
MGGRVTEGRRRRVSAWGLIGLFVALGAFSFLGDRLMFWIYAGLSAPLVVVHVAVLCRRCSNVACALNPRGVDFLFRRRMPGDDPSLPFSDLPAAWSALALSLVGAVGFVGTWRFSPLAAAAVFAAGVPLHLMYTRASCAHCGNVCLANRNPAYREWKAEQPAERAGR